MAGGTWTSQNKVQPGVYINTKSQSRVTSNIGTKGVVAIAEPLSWGPVGVIQEITTGVDVMPYIGYGTESVQARFLREMMKGSDTTPGPIKILLYRPSGTGGVKAAASIGALTATALYDGVRGNDITVKVEADPDNEGSYHVITVIDGVETDSQEVKDLSGLKPNAWVEFSGTGTEITESAGTALEKGVDPVVSADDYASFLAALEPHQFDVVVYDGTDHTTMQAFATFVKRLSDQAGFKCQAVMANAQDCDSEYVISVGNGVKLSDGTVLSAQQATWWLSGAEAGARYNESLTYAVYPDAIEASPKLTSAQVDAAILSGSIVFIDTFGVVRVCQDINTLITHTEDRGEEYSQNRVIRTLHQFCNDVYQQFDLHYIGKTDNTETGRNLLKGWIVGYLNEMQANNGIQNFEADDVSVEAGNATNSVLVVVRIQPIDSIEKIYMTVTVSVGVGE